MRYLAQRVGTGKWLHRDLPLSGVERVRELSGPGSITFGVPPGFRDVFAEDGLRVIEDWGTLIYAVDEMGTVRQGGIVVPSQEHDEDEQRVTAAGFSTYPHGYIRTESLPATSSAPALIQVDPIAMFREHWDWIQSQPDSDLGVQVVGSTASNVRIGTNEEPYRLEWFEAPDLGQAMDALAEATPFDFVEEHAWLDEDRDAVEHFVRLGWPRLGADRNDLRFVLGENIIETVAASTIEEYANDVVGIGNGEGSTMVWSRSSVSDGRLRRTRYVTDKTVKAQSAMDKRTRETLLRLSPTLDIGTVIIKHHSNAPIESIDLGDDIRVQTYLPTYGKVDMKVRVLSIGESDEAPGIAVLGTQRSNAFVYNPSESLS